MSTGVLILLAVLLDIDLLIKTAFTVILLSNIFAHLSVIIMRESTIQNYKPTYKAPFYPWLQIIGIIVFVLLIIDMGMQPILLSLAFTSVGIFLYFLRRGKLERTSTALIHVNERITNKKLVTEGLKNELRSIVENRDNIVRDEFDHVIENSGFLEIDKHITNDELWDIVSTEFKDILPKGLRPSQFKTLLKERED